MHIENLTYFERETLLRFFLYTLNPAPRRTIMEQYPVIYRKLLGRKDGEEFRDNVREAVLDEDAPQTEAELFLGRALAKTRLLREWAKRQGLPFHELDLSFTKPEDLRGLPFRGCPCGQEYTTPEQATECAADEAQREEDDNKLGTEEED